MPNSEDVGDLGTPSHTRLLGVGPANLQRHSHGRGNGKVASSHAPNEAGKSGMGAEDLAEILLCRNNCKDNRGARA